MQQTSFICAPILLNLLRKMRKSEKLRNLPNILLLFCDEFDNFYYTGARMLDNIYHMTLELY